MKTGKVTGPRLALAPLLSSLALVGCGSGDEGFPALGSSYGTAIGEEGKLQQTYTMSDGEVLRFTVTGRITVDTQSEGAWTGKVFRCERDPNSWCYSTGALAGTIGRDRSLRFTLTQARWRDCTALGPGEYTGLTEASTLFATGVTRVRCDDGREATVEETISMKIAGPPGYRPL